MSTLQNLALIKEELESSRQKLNEKFKKEIIGVFENFFKSYPAVYGFAWLQYTPYFNDGDECVFNMHDVYAFYDTETVRQAFEDGDASLAYGEMEKDGNVVDTSTYDYSRGYSAKERQERVLTEVEKVVDTFTTALAQFEDEMRYAFGDHSVVFVTRNGVDVQDYDDHE
jgi:hypothetical protein